MVEHLVCNQAVVGSNPVASTTIRHQAPVSLRASDVTQVERRTPPGSAAGSLKTRWIENVGNHEFNKRAWLSYQEWMVDALASRADEGRDIAAKSFGEPLSGL